LSLHAKICAVLPSLVLTLLASLAAAEPQSAPAPGASDQKQERPTGLPPRVQWTFDLDAGWASFGFANSLYANPRQDVVEQLSDQWFEGFVKPALSGKYTFNSAGEIYGKVSVGGERTYGSAPPLVVGLDASSFGPDDAYVGWRYRWLDVTVGRAPYVLGHGMLIMDGAPSGGSRGGYWTNSRNAFAMAAIARVKPGRHVGEFFYLDRDDLPEAPTDTRMWGANYEFLIDEDSAVGASYMRFGADPDLVPTRDGMHLFNARAYVSPIPAAPDLSIEFEYASERNGDLLQSNAWTLRGAWLFSSTRWTPEVSYRYARFQGDDPETEVRESFDPLLPGLHDWGSWWQGEIAGEYFLPNSNLVSHQVRLHVDPTEKVGAGLIAYRFLADQPGSFGPQVTSRDLAFELDLYVDWSLNQNVTLSLVGAFANPGAAVRESSGRTKNFVYGMVYLGYSF
jgi:hypothetical protein